MRYAVAERFKSIQGEGTYAGTPMAFIRFVGCSVGKKICHACDTDFEAARPWHGGGEYSAEQLVEWAAPYRHVCLTGGEPFDQDLMPLLHAFERQLALDHLFGGVQMVHVETSGTRPRPYPKNGLPGLPVWTCVSPKPGYISEVVWEADEVKVIVPGLGSGVGWPTLASAKLWALDYGRTVFLQPRNAKHEVDWQNVRLVQDIIAAEPYFRLSLQLHKLLKVQ